MLNFDLQHPSVATLAAAALAVVGGWALWRSLRRDPLAGIPRPPGLPVLGHVLEIERVGMHEFMKRAHREHGPVLALQLGPFLRAVSVGDPLLIREVVSGSMETYRVAMDVVWQYVKPVVNGLILLEGDAWRKSRRLTTPAFQPEPVRAMTEAIAGVTRAACDVWRPRRRIALNRELYKVTADVISLVALGFNLDLVHSQNRLTSAIEGLLLEIESRIYQPVQLWRYVWTPWAARFRRNALFVRSEVQRMLAERLGRAEQPRDMLATLVEAVRAGEMSEAQLAEEATIFLLAGHETTATALSFALYLLALHPAVQTRCRSEVEEVLGGGDPGEGDDLGRLRLVSAVFDEALRLYGPAHFISRQTARPASLGGYAIPPGVTVMLALYAVMRDPRHWGADPDSFNPDRFMPGGAGEGSRAFLPFSSGHRMCPGKPLAIHEARIIMSIVLRRFELGLPPGVEPGKDIPTRPAFVMRPAKDLEVVLTPLAH
eukprot:tig00020927_g15954.t1